jgi:hypothetical protein
LLPLLFILFERLKLIAIGISWDGSTGEIKSNVSTRFRNSSISSIVPDRALPVGVPKRFPKIPIKR